MSTDKIADHLLALAENQIPDEPIPESNDQEINKLINATNLLSAKLRKERETRAIDAARLESIQEILHDYLLRNFSRRAEIVGDHKEIDALALSINYFGEELKKSFEVISDQNSRLLRTNEEITTLLREIHHRVKNNMQIISSLLLLQSSQLDTEEIQKVFLQCQNRINSMAMIHEMLYRSTTFSKIQYGEYIEELAAKLIHSIKGPRNNVDYIVNAEDIYLNIDTSIPLGLIINEIITNSLKHGIKEKEHGRIHVKIDQKAPREFVLEVSDNGNGFPEKINAQTTDSVGLQLIDSLVLQLKGSMTVDTGSWGTKHVIKFIEID